jgi:hypothetical protein
MRSKLKFSTKGLGAYRQGEIEINLLFIYDFLWVFTIN